MFSSYVIDPIFTLMFQTDDVYVYGGIYYPDSIFMWNIVQWISNAKLQSSKYNM